MSNRKHVTPAHPSLPRVVRCAVYTRKSTEEGLEQSFNTLDAQRESGEAYIAAQRHEGWTFLPTRYDDGGYSGGNMDRPALTRLLADIEAGLIDCVVVYKVDRLSRSLLDFTRILQVFDSKGVSFVSVTQQFNTTHSMGRLTLNILLSFAQFEREIISERTRDKIAAARRKGKWSGGKPLLGYDIVTSPQGSKLVVNEDEAQQVRGIYDLYLQHEALIPTAIAVDKKGWVNKQWITRKGIEKGGRPFDKGSLHKLLTNRTYAGTIHYAGQHYPGEHQAIIEPALFDKVQAVLGRNGKTKGATVKNKYGALLRGLLFCQCCRCSMIHTYSAKAKSTKRYRYYVCLAAQKKGWHTCPSKSVPAGQIEKFVTEQVRRVGKDPAVLEATLRQVRQQGQKALLEANADVRAAERELARHHAAMKKTLTTADPTGLLGLNEKIATAEQRLTAAKERRERLKAEDVPPEDLKDALSAVWEQLSPREQARVIRVLVEKVDYDGAGGSVSITFRPSGIKTLANQGITEVAA